MGAAPGAPARGGGGGAEGAVPRDVFTSLSVLTAALRLANAPRQPSTPAENCWVHRLSRRERAQCRLGARKTRVARGVQGPQRLGPPCPPREVGGLRASGAVGGPVSAARGRGLQDVSESRTCHQPPRRWGPRAADSGGEGLGDCEGARCWRRSSARSAGPCVRHPGQLGRDVSRDSSAGDGLQGQLGWERSPGTAWPKMISRDSLAGGRSPGTAWPKTISRDSLAGGRSPGTARPGTVSRGWSLGTAQLGDSLQGQLDRGRSPGDGLQGQLGRGWTPGTAWLEDGLQGQLTQGWSPGTACPGTISTS